MMTQPALESPSPDSLPTGAIPSSESNYLENQVLPNNIKDTKLTQNPVTTLPSQHTLPKSLRGPPIHNNIQYEKRHSLPGNPGQLNNFRPQLGNTTGVPLNQMSNNAIHSIQVANSLGMPPTPTNGTIPSYVVPNSLLSNNTYCTPPLTPKHSFSYPSSHYSTIPDTPNNSTSFASPSSPSTVTASNTVPVSNLTGRKKALLIGINYFGTDYELKGCINDVKNIKEFLIESYNFPVAGMVIMTDDQEDNPARMPTKKNITEAMEWLVDGARPNDSLFLHFSGHGSQTPDLDGDEDDGFDETICPVDFKTEGMIVDDDMNSILVRPLPAGCRLTVLFDCCHSGTALDLPYIYNPCGELQTFHRGSAMVNALANLGAKTQEGDLAGAFNSLIHGVRHLVTGKQTELSNQKLKGGLADVIMFSGCEDSQTSADLKSDNMGTTGALSLALIAALRNNPSPMSYLELLNEVRRVLLENKFSQTPQLSTARPMDMNSIFQM